MPPAAPAATEKINCLQMPVAFISALSIFPAGSSSRPSIAEVCGKGILLYAGHFSKALYVSAFVHIMGGVLDCVIGAN
jgi:hypothetical protein